MVRLASGQQMVTRLKDRGVDVAPLTRAQILGGNGGAQLDDLTPRRTGRWSQPGLRCGSTSCARPS